MPRLVFIVSALIASLFATTAWPADQGPQTRPSAGPGGDDPLGSLLHSSVSMPLEDLRGLLERNARERPPVDFAFSPAAYEAAVSDNGVAVSASVDVSLLVDSWVLAPIGPSGSGVTRATVDGQPVPLVLQGDQLYLLLKGKGQKKVALAISRDLGADAGTVRFDLPLLPSAMVSVSASLPARSRNARAPGAAGVSITENARATVIQGTYHGGVVATVQWRPAPPPGVAVEARTDADVATLMTIDRGVLRTRTNLRVQIQHASAKELKIDIDSKLTVLTVDGQDIVEWKEAPAAPAADRKTIAVHFAAEVDGERLIDIVCERDLPEAGKENAGKGNEIDFRPPSLEGANRDRGFIGVEVRDSVEVTPAPPDKRLQRIDVKDLPESILGRARSPVLFAYRYDAPEAKLALAMTRNADLDVLVAMSDVCEASTTFTPDGKSITKMMFVTRNNLKQFMTLKMPEGAQIWSAFVGDHPVTPAKNAKGEVLIPLRKSDPEEADDDDASDGQSYRARRERRRGQGVEGKLVDRVKRLRERKAGPADDAAPDLKPYDVEIVFVTPPVKLGDRGQVRPALPQSDVPIGHLSWAIFLPANLRVVDAEGNVTEVSHFTLPFRHFGDVAYESGQHAARQDQAMRQAMQELAQAEKKADFAERARAQGVLPVRIEIPMVGEIHRFEKFLTVEEAPSVSLTYGRRID